MARHRPPEPVDAAAPVARVRPFKPADLSALHRVREAAFAPVFRSFRDLLGEEIAATAFAHAEAEQARLLDEMCSPMSAHRVLVLTLGDEILGFVAFTTDALNRTGEICLNAIHPDHTGRGLGTWMYDEVLQQMRDLGMQVATVSTGGDPSHAAARRAYAKAGFGPAIPSLNLFRTL